MNIKPKINNNEQFSSGYLFFILVAVILGVELIAAPRIIFLEAGHDAWISILLAYFYIILVLVVMFYILRQYEDTDIIGIQLDLFGPFIAKTLGSLYILYFGIYALTILMLYIELIRIFIFPDLPPFILGLMTVILMIYSLLGGIRIIVGVVFTFFILAYPIFLFLLGKPLLETEILHFLPVLDASIQEIGQGTISTAYTFMGFEILFFIYPFIQNKKKALKFSISGFSLAVFIVLFTTIISIGYFNPAQLERRVFPIVNLFKLQSFPFLERIDYLIVGEWMMIMLPNAILLVWAIVYSMKRLYKVSEKTTIYVFSIFLLLFLSIISEYFSIEAVIDIVESFGFWLVYVYPFILLPFVLIKKRRKKNQKGSEAN